MTDKSIRIMKNNPSLKGMAVMLPDVIFSTAQGVELKMQIIKPWDDAATKDQIKYPLIVFVQGSAWTFPNVYAQIPQLSLFAREGYVVATLTHRNSQEGHQFPAFLQDIKAGIRFLRKNAKEYQIDPDRVGIWGTSSGGNTALLVGLTGDDNRYETNEHTGYSDAVKLVVDCFGPTDLFAEDNPLRSEEYSSIFNGLRGEDTKENMEKLQEINPLNHVKEGMKYPPFLILHGNQDNLVYYSQSELIYSKLLEVGADASFVCVEGAPHEGSFWSNELLQLIKEFIDTNM